MDACPLMNVERNVYNKRSAPKSLMYNFIQGFSTTQHNQSTALSGINTTNSSRGNSMHRSMGQTPRSHFKVLLSQTKTLLIITLLPRMLNLILMRYYNLSAFK